MRFANGARVFGNGTRFVWHGSGPKEEHVMEGALVIEMKASLVTVHEILLELPNRSRIVGPPGTEPSPAPLRS